MPFTAGYYCSISTAGLLADVCNWGLANKKQEWKYTVTGFIWLRIQWL
jgi:hypothetical protein